jgi:RNA polymerase sigma factor (sigma-70 family)
MVEIDGRSATHGTDRVQLAFAAVYEAEHPRMVRLARMMVGSQSVAEELAHDSFVRLHGAWDRVENPGAFVRTILVNLCRTWLTRSAREDVRPIADDRTELPAELDETWAALCRLPDRYRIVLALRFYDDLAEADIAAILGCRVGTVRSQIHRGLARLRKEIS